MRFVKATAWLNLIGNLVIIGTGGAVRLTESGLGCDTWPMCTGESWTPTPEDGIHGIIEFSNRLMSPVLAVFAILALIAVWRMRQTRRDLWVHALILGSGIVLQAVVGGITVLTGLNAVIVATHYLASAALVGVATSFLVRASWTAGPRERAIPMRLYLISHITTVILALVLIGGVITTANGPHSGDADVRRDSAMWETFVHVHAWFSYALVTALVILLVGALITRAWRYLASIVGVIVIVGVQIIVGITQANTGIPPLLVGIHMVLAGIAVIAMVLMVYATKRPVEQQAA